MKKITAIIGIGHWGTVHFKYLIKLSNIEIKYIYYRKIYPKNLPTKYKKKITDNLNKILNDKEIQYVHIVTPIKTHETLANLLIKKNKKILVEKPLLMKKVFEKKIYQSIKNKQYNLHVSYPYLFSKSLISSKEIINTKKLGLLKYIEINLRQCGRFMDYDVNTLLAPHAFSILSIFYNIKNIQFDLDKIIYNGKNCETAIIRCKKDKKIISLINLSLNYANNINERTINLFLKNGMIKCNLNDSVNTLQSFRYSRVKKNNYKTAKIKNYINKFYDEKNNMQYVIENFYNNKNNLKNFELTQTINNFLKKK